MTTATFHSIHPGTHVVACDECGCTVAATERDKLLHADWHTARDARVIDLTREVALEIVAKAS